MTETRNESFQVIRPTPTQPSNKNTTADSTTTSQNEEYPSDLRDWPSIQSGKVGRQDAFGPDVITLTVYKDGGIFARNLIVGSEDKSQVSYYVIDHTAWYSPHYNFTLHRNGKQGPAAVHVTKKGWAPFKFEKDGNLIDLVKLKRMSWRHEFFIDGVLFVWTRDKWYSNNWSLVRKQRNQEILVAQWKEACTSAHTHGKIIIIKSFEAEIDLIVATAIALEKWARAERQTKAASPSNANKSNEKGYRKLQ